MGGGPPVGLRPPFVPPPMRQRQQTRQDATYRSRKSVQTTGASSIEAAQHLTRALGQIAALPGTPPLAGRRARLLISPAHDRTPLEGFVFNAQGTRCGKRDPPVIGSFWPGTI